MLVQFVADHEYTSYGFTAKFFFTPINPNCTDWLNITSRILTSPDYPTMDCTWIITAPIANTISFNFHTIEVKY